MFSEEIQQLRTVPETPVVSREIRVSSPWKTWQYFQISDNRIGEVRCDGQTVLPGETIPETGDHRPGLCKFVWLADRFFGWAGGWGREKG
jgi:hypothetical protein